MFSNNLRNWVSISNLNGKVERDANLPVPGSPCGSRADICLPGRCCGFASSRTHPEGDMEIAFPFCPAKQTLLFAKGSVLPVWVLKSAAEPLQMPLGSPPFCRLFHRISSFWFPAFAQFLPHPHYLLPKTSPRNAPTFPLASVPQGFPFLP